MSSSIARSVVKMQLFVVGACYAKRRSRVASCVGSLWSLFAVVIHFCLYWWCCQCSCDRYKELVLASIVRLGSPPGSAPGTFVRKGNTVVSLVVDAAAPSAKDVDAEQKTSVV